jgi:hypothetical protein
VGILRQSFDEFMKNLANLLTSPLKSFEVRAILFFKKLGNRRPASFSVYALLQALNLIMILAL